MHYVELFSMFLPFMKILTVRKSGLNVESCNLVRGADSVQPTDTAVPGKGVEFRMRTFFVIYIELDVNKEATFTILTINH